MSDEHSDVERAALRISLLALRCDLAMARDCGQDGTCAIAPGCQRHWEERNRELWARAEAAEAKLAELVRAVRDWYGGKKLPTLHDIVDKYSKPDGGA